MQVTAQLNNLRISPRKVRLLLSALKGMDATRAQHQLVYITKRSSRPMAKLLDSAIANAKNNFSLVISNLFIKQIIVNEGAKLKRHRPKGFGSASPIEKKTSHIKIILEEKVIGLRDDKKAEAAAEGVVSETTTAPKRQTKKKAGLVKNDGDAKKGRETTGGSHAKIFSRKSI